jgi:hypothetical protein
MKALLLCGRKAGNQQFPQASLIAILQERKTERKQDCTAESLQD